MGWLARIPARAILITFLASVLVAGVVPTAHATTITSSASAGGASATFSMSYTTVVCPNGTKLKDVQSITLTIKRTSTSFGRIWINDGVLWRQSVLAGCGGTGVGAVGTISVGLPSSDTVQAALTSSSTHKWSKTVTPNMAPATGWSGLSTIGGWMDFSVRYANSHSYSYECIETILITHKC